MDKLKIPAIILNQKGKELYLFKIKASTLANITYVTPRSEENPNELQRVVNTARAKEIGKWLKEDTSLLPNAIVIDLKNNIKIEHTAYPDQVTIHIPNPETNPNHKIAYILDGQHRVKGFEFSDGVDFELAVIAVHGVTENIRAQLFIDINSKQVKIDERLLLDLMAGNQILENNDELIYSVIKRLNDDPSSALYGKIQFLPEQRNRWIKNTTMLSLLKPHLANGGCIYTKTTAQKIEIITSYFNAIKSIYHNQWDDQRNYLLTKSIGFEILLGIFSAIKNRCDLYEARQLNKDSFVKQLSIIKDQSISLKLKDQSTINIDLNWTSRSMGQFSNKQWIREIIKELTNILNS